MQQVEYPTVQILGALGKLTSFSLDWLRVRKVKLCQGDLVSFLVVLAIPWGGNYIRLT